MREPGLERDPGLKLWSGCGSRNSMVWVEAEVPRRRRVGDVFQNPDGVDL